MSVFTHVVVGSNDIQKSKAFYDAVLAAIGMQCLMAVDDARLMYGTDSLAFIVTKPRNGEPATFANGGTIGFKADTSAQVDAFHAAALANGGSCEGEPGPREVVPNAYGAYVRDPDGNKFSIYAFGQV
ncbi:VOC family protein [Halioxenophilus sp. WMMB6]|uniref:VOC family protein n=1 Tax=Halioxenophilus sp. WMMB6 TaxID=3073815 RepID=UPI00295F0D8D|nr:VOC family protein [Halioxenophilus sp. WMMB6]